MKKLFLCTVAIIAMMAQNSIAQIKSDNALTSSCPKFYLGFSTGIDNPVGLLGVNVDVPIDNFSLGAGLGLSSWGLKLALDGKYYFGQCNKGWAVGAGFTHSTGTDGVKTELELANGITREVVIDAKATTNMFLSAYHFFKIGRQNRFHIQLGYSARLTGNDVYEVKTLGANGFPVVLSNLSDQTMRTLAPGGLILGLGFSFAL